MSKEGSREELARKKDTLFEVVERAKKLSANLMNMARKDLEAARTLYEKGLYPQAVFMVEQCCEKALKSLLVEEWVSRAGEGLSINDVNEAVEELKHVEKKLKSIGHSFKGFYKEVLTYRCNVERNIQRLYRLVSSRITTANSQLEESAISELQKLITPDRNLLSICEDPKRVNSYIDELYRYAKNLARDENQLNHYLGELEFMHSTAVNYARNVLESTERYVQELKAKKESIAREIRSLESLIAVLGGEATDLGSKLGWLLNEHPELFVYMSAFIMLEITRYITFFSIFILLSPHTASSRYPSEELNPLELYTEQLPLVKHMGRVTRLLEDSFGLLEQLKNDIALRLQALSDQSR